LVAVYGQPVDFARLVTNKNTRGSMRAELTASTRSLVLAKLNRKQLLQPRGARPLLHASCVFSTVQYVAAMQWLQM
jgi:hypothetical protein